MSGNSIGKTLVLTTFGESHGPAVGGVLDGFPPGISIDLDFIQSEVNRRKSAQHFFSSSRHEEDSVEFLSGIFEGLSTGAPLAFLIRNTDANPAHYDQLKEAYRPSHADYTWEKKFGIRDYRGGGRASARETISRVVGGALAKLYLKEEGITATAFVSRIGDCFLPKDFILRQTEDIKSSPVGCPDPVTSAAMLRLLEKTRAEGDTLGGVVNCSVKGVPAGLGEPVFDKLSADLARAMVSIPSVTGFEFGSGFSAAEMRGTDHNDLFCKSGEIITTLTNHSGGIQGGISNGNEIQFRVAFKPVASVMKDQETIDRKGEKVLLKGKGRHDVCVVPRALVIVESMAALVIADHHLRQKRYRD